MSATDQTTAPNPDQLLAGLRTYLDAAQLFAADHDGAADVTALANAAHFAAQLDAHLSVGGTPPTAWVKGSGVAGQEPWGWQDDDRQPLEGFDVFAHWSKAHPGVNVEVDAPNGLPLTVHVNDWRAVNIIIGTHGELADPDRSLLDAAPGITLSRDQLECWAAAGPLTDEEINRLGDAIPNSPIPAAVAAIIDSILFDTRSDVEGESADAPTPRASTTGHRTV